MLHIYAMRLLFVNLFCLLSLSLVITQQTNASRSSNVTNTTTRTGRDGQSIRGVVKEDISIAQQQLKMHKEQFWDDVEEGMNIFEKKQQTLYREFQDTSQWIHEAVRRSQRRFKQRLMENIFAQRVGWNRLCHSVRDYFGFTLGLWLTFRGYKTQQPASSALTRGSAAAVAIQTAQFGWHVLETHFALPHAPWMLDAVTISVGVVTWKHLPFAMSGFYQKYVPSLFLGVALFQCWLLVLNEWNENNEHGNTPFLTVFVAIGLSYLGFYSANIPFSLASFSLTGAMLIYDSVRAEIAGNWMYMLETLAQVVSEVMYAVCRIFQFIWRQRKRLFKFVLSLKPVYSKLHPVKEAIASVRSTIYKPLNKMSLYIRTHPIVKTIHKFAKQLQKAVRPVSWPVGIAMMGIAIQMDYITNVPGFLRFLRLSLDPVSYMLKKLDSKLDFQSRAQHAFNTIFRSAVSLVVGKAKKNATKKQSQ